VIVAPRRAPAGLALAATLALALLLWLVWGRPEPGYDAWWSLVWGRKLAHGALPDLTGAVAPTPHPLAYVVAAPLSVLGRGAPVALAVISLLALAVCGTATALLGARLFGPVAGALAAAILVTRPLLLGEALQCSVDVWFLALVLCAGAVLARERPGWGSALALLVAAGLLRPEGWPLAAAAALAWWLADRRRTARALAVALAAPLLWMLADLLCTGDPLHSLHGTRELADGLGRPQSAGTALRVLPDYLTAVLRDTVALVGGTAALVAIWTVPRRAAGPLAVLGLGLAGFVVLGVAGLPLLYRYTLLPAAALAVLAGWAPIAWTVAPRGTLLRAGLAAGGAVAAIALAVGVPGDLRAAGHDADGAALHARESRDLTALVHTAPVAAALRGPCGALALSQQRPVPQVAYLLGRAPAAVRVGGSGPIAGVALVAVPGSAAARDVLAPGDRPAPDPRALAAMRPLAAHRAWTAFTAVERASAAPSGTAPPTDRKAQGALLSGC
jgi:hypothetical protein